jgi:glucose-1-phosphate thymidylyltransferase
MSRGMAWLDTDTHDSLYDATTFVATIERWQGLMIACPEEIAWWKGWIDGAAVPAMAAPLRGREYGRYLERIVWEGTR